MRSTAAVEKSEAVPPRHRFLAYQAAPAWLISMLVHILILLILGLVTIADPVQIVNVLTANHIDEGPEIEEFTIDVTDPSEISEPDELSEPISDISESLEVSSPVAVEPMEITEVAVEMQDMAAEMAAPSQALQQLASIIGPAMSSRSADMKKKLLREYGGSESSEAAVTKALQWLSRHQMPNGAWTFNHHLVCNGACGNPGMPERANAYNAATSLALLPFMGAGQTHVEGEFKDVVFRGLRFLIQNGKPGKRGGLPVLDLSEGFAGNMYSHGFAAITLCEAYAMTGDPELAGPAQAALNFIVYSQCRDGGWRYIPQWADGGDTSVTGWMVMALKSGHMGHLSIPPKTIQGSMLFLDKVSSNGGSWYGYLGPQRDLNRSCTAIGLLCRMYTGWDKTHPGIVRGVESLSEVGVNKKDIYYTYYAAQVLRHYGGAKWDQFNNDLRNWLVTTQSQQGGARGSWHFPESERHRGPREGGRLVSTAFATMILEVYYRHMPLYAEAAAEEDFPL